ncbi:efflux RND transporter permease subunit [Candidatus Obscuribacterales bacterium]|nr:efflux RND transporter permease subunit [Candidatus Obscuribacterales bacterium]MBX3148704.1 efflux RND transporter permease subunit [Candidatus Obscuribacterales bacterium]
MNLRYISAWSIKNPVPVLVLFLVLTVAGLTCFFGLGIDESPNIDVPIVSITVNQVGAAPPELESQVTRKIEDAVAGIGNVKHIVSKVNEGVSATTIEFELETNVDRAVNDVRNEVSKIRTQLPPGIDEPIVQRLDFVGGPFVTYSVSSDRRSVEELSWITDNEISRALLGIKGVGQVERAGGVDREIRVNLDPARLESLGITADMVSTQVRSVNTNLPGGRGEVGAQEESVRTLGSAPSAEKLAATRIALPRGRWARLDTLGTVNDSSTDQRQMAMIDNKPVISFSIVRSSGANMVTVEEAVDQKLEALEKTLPPDIKIKKIRSQTIFVHMSYHAALDSLLIGGGLAVLVVWLFLKDWRSAVISSLAMPLSLIPTFAVMKVAGFTMNNMSLLGLALVIGVLVDDAIVEIENIVRHMSMGKKPFQAAFDAADEIGLAVVATTMTIIVVFVPVAFMGGIPGKFLWQFGLTVAAAVFFSLVVARMLTPLMAAYLLTPVKETHGNAATLKAYNRILIWSLNNRWKTVAVGVAFFALSIVLFKMMPTSVIGNIDRGESMLIVEMPPGTQLADTERAVKHLTNLCLKDENVQSVFAQIGSGMAANRRSAATAGEVNKGTLYISLKPRDKRQVSQQDFEAEIRGKLLEVPGARLSFEARGGITGKLKLILVGNDTPVLRHYTEKLTDQMRGIAGVNDIVSTAALERPEIQVYPNFERASEQGISVESIARTALIATLGDIDRNLPKFNLPERQINIRVQIDPKYREDVHTVKNLRVAAADGSLVPLVSVADIKFASGEAQIDRYDRYRQVTIDASLANGLPLGEALKKVQALPAWKEMPKTVRNIPAGDVEIQKDIFGGFAWALTVGVLLIYGVLALLFGGFLHPLTIMMSLPLALGGALIALCITGDSLGFYALIGIVMLMGLVTKNAILLVEYCLMAMHAGKDRLTAIMEAGEARMRPILMTTVAMVAGMLPIAIRIGAGSEARAPMAIAVIGGLITSTLLTLVVIPVVFTLIDDAQNWLRKLFVKLNLNSADELDESSMNAAQTPRPQYGDHNGTTSGGSQQGKNQPRESSEPQTSVSRH